MKQASWLSPGASIVPMQADRSIILDARALARMAAANP
jgi:hypothetical protein